jgi:N-acetylglutamate synthase
VLASVTGAEAAVLNLVLVAAEGAQEDMITDLLDQVQATRVPHRLQAAADDAERVGRLALRRGMQPEAPVPLMVLEDLSTFPADAGSRPGLVIRELAPQEAATHPEVAALGFEAPIGPMVHVTRESVLSTPGVRCYVGEVDGRPVTTGLGVTVGPHVGLFTIATMPEHRRRGHGAALTARALLDARAHGASWAWLQSSDSGFGVYQRLGFRTLERSASWRSDGGD